MGAFKDIAGISMYQFPISILLVFWSFVLFSCLNSAIFFSKTLGKSILSFFMLCSLKKIIIVQIKQVIKKQIIFILLFV